MKSLNVCLNPVVYVKTYFHCQRTTTTLFDVIMQDRKRNGEKESVRRVVFLEIISFNECV